MTSPQSSQTMWPPPRNSAPSTPPYLTCHIGCQPHHPLDSPPRPPRPNQQVPILHAPLPPQRKKIPHLVLMTTPLLSTTSTPLCTAPTTTPGLEKCSATPSCTPRLSPTLGRRSNFAPANMTCRNLPRPPNTRTTSQNTSPPMLRLPAPAVPPEGKRLRRQLRPRSPTEASKPATSLPFASRRFFAIRETPLPHPRAARITKTFPDIIATTLTESNCLLPKGFSVKVNDRGAVSLTGTDAVTPAESYAPYFDAITRHLNQSYRTGSSPWLSFSLAPTAVQLAIHSVPIDVLPDDDDQLFPFLKSSILKAKAVKISAARYLNKDRASRISKQATSVVVSGDPDDVQKLLPSFFLFSKRLKVEKTVNANRYTQCNNCYRFGHASQRCKQTHPSCPFCALHHTRSAHRCQNPTCPKGGNSRPISGCCPTSPPHCPNCRCDHDAFSREYRARPTPPPRPEVPASNHDETGSDGEEDLEMEDDGGQVPSTSKTRAAQAVDITTPRSPRRVAASTGEAFQPMGGPAPPDSNTSQRVPPGNE